MYFAWTRTNNSMHISMLQHEQHEAVYIYSHAERCMSTASTCVCRDTGAEIAIPVKPGKLNI